jgi:SAM-dependent methyltransferase
VDDKPTIIVDYYSSAPRGRPTYKGLVIHALPGLHEYIAEKATHLLPPEATVLDIAAGSGAMCQRLLDLGFRVSATDYIRENFKLDGVPFIQTDLNQPFASLHPNAYQGIIACEIIEHLENPRHFARQCFQLLTPGGRMLLTTPNVDSASSKASFIRFGTSFWFDDDRYHMDGHITPLTQWQVHKVFTEAGFNFLWEGSYGDPMHQNDGSPRLRLVAKVISLATKQDRRLGGDIFVAALERPRP